MTNLKSWREAGKLGTSESGVYLENVDTFPNLWLLAVKTFNPGTH